MNLDSIEISLIGLVVGGIAYYALGALWYTVLFGERWIAATGRTREEFPNSSPAWMVVTLISGMVTTAVIAILYQWGGGDGLVDGLAAGAIIGIGVAAMEMLKDVVYQYDTRRNVWGLYVINGSYTVLGLILAGGVYGVIATL